mmetsp:Transcript_5560/g.10134  ORF Transcript_5560/g.10134 Transcript_5560/m.10134 type:complete len:255 (-) Transcript_5560:226-990(-)
MSKFSPLSSMTYTSAFVPMAEETPASGAVTTAVAPMIMIPTLTTSLEEKEKKEREQWCNSIFTTTLQLLTPAVTVTTTTSIDEDLARVTSQSLTMGSSIVTDLPNSSVVVFPHKLHPALYNNSMADASMSSSNNNNSSSCKGTPGFPDFPDCWQGQTSAGERQIKDVSMDKTHTTRKWRVNNAKAKKQQRRLIRKAVNPAGTASCVQQGKEIKKRLRGDRRIRRKEKAAQLQQRRQRKREMGNICQGLASINCK